MADVHIWRVEGAGGVRAYRNGALVEDMTSGQSNITVQYNIGDSFKFEAYPDPGWQFAQFCGDPGCSIKTNQNSFSGTITQPTGNVYVYFAPESPKITVTVFKGSGTVKVYRNGAFQGETKTTGTFDFVIGDSVQFEAVPDENFVFEKYCTDVKCLITTKANPFTAPVTQGTGTVLAYFSEKGISPFWIVTGIGVAVIGALAIYKATKGKP